jgi:hypothetical protein
MRYDFPSSIQSDYKGYKILLDFFNKTNGLFLDEIILNFQNNTWFEANLFAVLGAILNKIEDDLNPIKIENLPKKLETLMRRNHFSSHFGGDKLPDFYETTIKYKKFRPTEEKLFKNYLDRELLSSRLLPDMSIQLRKKINESIFEIFNNAILHGNCKNIFTCGQSFKVNNRLDFTIVDLGTTIKANINNYLDANLTGEEAIQWAAKEGNTTKSGAIPGGLGLSLIREFLEKNNGKIQIISAEGFWEQKEQMMDAKGFALEFPGTIVNLEFNTDDKMSYYLASEINVEDIF